MQICVSKLGWLVIGSDNGVSAMWYNPLSESMLAYSWLDFWEQIAVKGESKHNIIH